METQTDGVEWVLATLFLVGVGIVIAAAIREIVKFRQGDPGGEEGKGPGRGR